MRTDPIHPADAFLDGLRNQRRHPVSYAIGLAVHRFLAGFLFGSGILFAVWCFS